MDCCAAEVGARVSWGAEAGTWDVGSGACVLEGGQRLHLWTVCVELLPAVLVVGLVSRHVLALKSKNKIMQHINGVESSIDSVRSLVPECVICF